MFAHFLKMSLELFSEGAAGAWNKWFSGEPGRFEELVKQSLELLELGVSPVYGDLFNRYENFLSLVNSMYLLNKEKIPQIAEALISNTGFLARLLPATLDVTKILADKMFIKKLLVESPLKDQTKEEDITEFQHAMGILFDKSTNDSATEENKKIKGDSLVELVETPKTLTKKVLELSKSNNLVLNDEYLSTLKALVSRYSKITAALYFIIADLINFLESKPEEEDVPQEEMDEFAITFYEPDDDAYDIISEVQNILSGMTKVKNYTGFELEGPTNLKSYYNFLKRFSDWSLKVEVGIIPRIEEFKFFVDLLNTPFYKTWEEGILKDLLNILSSLLRILEKQVIVDVYHVYEQLDDTASGFRRFFEVELFIAIHILVTSRPKESEHLLGLLRSHENDYLRVQKQLQPKEKSPVKKRERSPTEKKSPVKEGKKDKKRKDRETPKTPEQEKAKKALDSIKERNAVLEKKYVLSDQLKSHVNPLFYLMIDGGVSDIQMNVIRNAFKINVKDIGMSSNCSKFSRTIDNQKNIDYYLGFMDVYDQIMRDAHVGYGIDLDENRKTNPNTFNLLKFYYKDKVFKELFNKTPFHDIDVEFDKFFSDNIYFQPHSYAHYMLELLFLLVSITSKAPDSNLFSDIQLMMSDAPKLLKLFDQIKKNYDALKQEPLDTEFWGALEKKQFKVEPPKEPTKKKKEDKEDSEELDLLINVFVKEYKGLTDFNQKYLFIDFPYELGIPSFDEATRRLRAAYAGLSSFKKKDVKDKIRDLVMTNRSKNASDNVGKFLTTTKKPEKIYEIKKAKEKLEESKKEEELRAEELRKKELKEAEEREKKAELSREEERKRQEIIKDAEIKRQELERKRQEDERKRQEPKEVGFKDIVIDWGKLFEAYGIKNLPGSNPKVNLALFISKGNFLLGKQWDRDRLTLLREKANNMTQADITKRLESLYDYFNEISIGMEAGGDVFDKITEAFS